MVISGDLNVFFYRQTLVAVCGLCIGWLWAALWIESAGNPAAGANGYVVFNKDTFLQVIANSANN